MIQFDDMREMERRASIYCGDGLLDIGLGVGLFLLGFAMIFGFGALAVIYLAAAFSIAKVGETEHHRSADASPRLHAGSGRGIEDAGRSRGVMRASARRV